MRFIFEVLQTNTPDWLKDNVLLILVKSSGKALDKSNW